MKMPYIDMAMSAMSGMSGMVSAGYAALMGFTAYWKCDEAAGQNFTDQSANALTLTQTNSPGTAAGQIGTSRSFTAASSMYGARDSSATLQRNKDWTLSYWAYHSTVPGWQIHVSKDDGIANREFLVGLNPGGVMELQVNGSTLLTHGTTLLASTWYNVVVTWTQATKSAALIVNNGTPVTGTAAAAISATTAPWLVGCYSSPPGLFHNGRLDDIVLWDSVLSASLITLNYGRTSPLV